jgi:antitoxin VapB
MAYTYVYANSGCVTYMAKTAKVFMNNRSQAVRLPKEFQFDTPEVFIRKVGDEVILSPRPDNWTALVEGPYASPGFMEGVEDLPVQDRSF